MILPELTKLINKRKNNNSNEQKVQLRMGINFMNINECPNQIITQRTFQKM